MEKAILRKEYLQKRRQILPDLRAQYLAQMLAIFRNLSLPIVRNCLLYHAITRHAEISLELFASKLRAIYPRCTFSYPVTRADFSWYLRSCDETTLFAPSELGIMEPCAGEQIFVSELDLIFVPLLCYDLRGYRVGYGKGIYDQILAQSRADTLKIGLSYFPPVPKITDLRSEDLPLDLVITPERIYQF